MKKFILILATLILTLSIVSYGAAKKKTVGNNNTPQKVAENFINGYAARNDKSVYNWVLKNSNITEDFRNIYGELIEYANSFDWSEGIPENYLGVPMDADWILTGQDFANQGYKTVYYDENTGYVLLKAQKVFSTYVKMVNINGNWYVDGAGYVNTYDFPYELNERFYN